jgi:hypothetical protein
MRPDRIGDGFSSWMIENVVVRDLQVIVEDLGVDIR